MTTTIINAKFFDDTLHSLHLDGEKFFRIERQKAQVSDPSAREIFALRDASSQNLKGQVFDAQGMHIYPGMIDAHVHVREPGLTHKEDWQTFAAGALKGGVVGAADMPNTVPPTMDLESVKAKKTCAEKTPLAFKFFLGVSDKNLPAIPSLLQRSDLPICGLKIYYGHSTGNLMFNDLPALAEQLKAARLDPLIVFHSEDQCCIDDNTAKLGGPLRMQSKSDFKVHSEIRSVASAIASTRTIIEWAHKHNVRLHLAHVSTGEEVEMAQDAKAKGLRITTEVAPHHLFFSTEDYARLGGFLKINPPVRPPKTVEALRQYFAKGYLDCFATDHAPHTLAEKQKAIYDAVPSGAPAVEFFLPLLFKLAKDLGMSVEKASALGSARPAELFGFEGYGKIAPGYFASFSLVDWKNETIENQKVVSKCQWTPYHGITVPCQVLGTWHRGQLFTNA